MKPWQSHTTVDIEINCNIFHLYIIPSVYKFYTNCTMHRTWNHHILCLQNIKLKKPCTAFTHPKILRTQHVHDTEWKFWSLSRNLCNWPSRIGCRTVADADVGSIPALPPLSLWEVDGWSPKFHDGIELAADNTLKAPLFCIARIQQAADNRSIEHPTVQSNIVLAWNKRRLWN